MKKIISLYQRNYDDDRLVRDEVVPGAEWVFAEEGTPHRKFDGTCCMFRDGILYKRYDAKKGKQPPEGFIPAQEPDPKTGHWPGWLRVGDGPEDAYHREAWNRKLSNKISGLIPDGTYELIGPKVQGNPEGVDEHQLVRHYWPISDLPDPLTFDGIREYLATHNIEGIVWHHPDGRMVKIKAKDFGLKRGAGK